MRALIIVLDSAGCGGAPDADAYQDGGANTLGAVFRAHPELHLPTLDSMGLWKIVTGDLFSTRAQHSICRWGRMRPRSAGKDSITGHWEMAGVILKEPFANFTQAPATLLEELKKACATDFLAAKGVEEEALMECGNEHLCGGRPILFMTPDSALHIAMHESVAPLGRLFDLCRQGRRAASEARVARIVARPFAGGPERYRWVAGRHELGITPPRTVLNSIAETGLPVHGIGPIRELFAGSGITRSSPTLDNTQALAAITAAWKEGRDGLTFANLPEMDPAYARRVTGRTWAAVLREFDDWLKDFLPQVEPEDLVIVTADHGGERPGRGLSFTREEAPLMVLHQGFVGPLGTRKTFADVAATLREYFKLREPWPVGESFAFHPRLRMGEAQRPPLR